MTDQSDIGAMLSHQFGKLIDESLDQQTLKASESGVWHADLWNSCEEMGLPLLLLPEASGGFDLPWVTAAALFRQLGQYCVPLPIGETAIAARLLADAGLDIPSGPLTFASGPDMLGAIPWARNAGYLVMVNADGNSVRTDCLAIGDERVVPGTNIGRDPRDKVDIARLKLCQSATLPGTSNPALEYGALLRATQMAGALAQVTSMTVDYANTRVQFGKPIRAFQAVQQSLACLASEAAAADVAANAAATAHDRGDAFFETAIAKIRTGEAAGTGSALGHQAHGAIGFTDEYTLHYLTRRLLSWRSEFGSERYWANTLGQQILESQSEPWAIITGSDRNSEMDRDIR